jgi:uncharacterized SAM-binding protein YcdF (DUF218 family)
MTINAPFSDIEQSIETVWNYHHVHHPLESADVLLVLGGHDLRVAEYAAKLFLRGVAPFIVVSGGIAHTNDLLNTGWEISEADMFAQVMEKAGVPSEKIVLEKQATNTGENFSLSRELIEEQHPDFQTVLAVTKPYMERRALATGTKQWPDKKIIVTSPPLSFQDYVAGDILRDDVINLMMGDLQRIDVYGQKGFQTIQEIPREVWEALEVLKSAGYTKHLLK